MKRNNFKTFECLSHIQKHSKKWMLLGLVFALVFLGSVGSLHAEIYKWQDETGTIHYSNTPPKDLSRILEKYPTEKVPLVEDANGVIYYLNVPVGSPEVDIPEITVSPEVLNEIMKDAPEAQVQPPKQPFLDMTTITIRLAEVEKALEREIGSRLKWEHEYARAQTLVKDLESQNKVLRLALAQMGNDLKGVQKAIVVSDMQLAELKNPQHKQQLAMLERKVDDLQSHLNTTIQQSDQSVAMVQTEIETVKTAQGEELETLNAKLNRLESEIEAINELALSEKFATLSTEIHKLESQQQPDHDVQVKLASLETDLKQLMDALPSSRRASETVAGLIENGNVLKTISKYQARQLDVQKDQIDTLRAEIQQLKEQITIPTNAVFQQDDSSDSLLAALVEKNTFMEAVIKHQANVLNTQNDQIKAIEAKMVQLQIPVRPVREQGGIAIMADNVEEELPTSGIRIVARQERRRSRDILDLFRAPPFQKIEKK
jgi:hypothetical protein